MLSIKWFDIEFGLVNAEETSSMRPGGCLTEPEISIRLLQTVL